MTCDLSPLYLCFWPSSRRSCSSARIFLIRGPPMREVRNVSKTFNPGTPNELRALQSVSVKVEDGSFIVIIGTNGSGKSTLLNAVAGSFRIDSGLISVAGQEITSWPEHRRAKLIGRVFQNP